MVVERERFVKSITTCTFVLLTSLFFVESVFANAPVCKGCEIEAGTAWIIVIAAGVFLNFCIKQLINEEDSEARGLFSSFSSRTHKLLLWILIIPSALIVLFVGSMIIVGFLEGS